MNTSRFAAKRSKFAAALLFLSAMASGAVSSTAHATVDLAPPGITLAAEFGDYGLGYATTGASQVKGDGSSSSTNCSSSNTASSSATLTVPAGATKVKTYLYWLGLEQHPARGYPTFTAITPSVTFTPAGGSATGWRSAEYVKARQSVTAPIGPMLRR